MRQYVCPACGAANRAAESKDPLVAKCGRCKRSLLSAHPIDVDAEGLHAHCGCSGRRPSVQGV